MINYTYLVLLQRYCKNVCQVPLCSCDRRLKGFFNLPMSNRTKDLFSLAFLWHFHRIQSRMFSFLMSVTCLNKCLHGGYTQWYTNPSTKCNQYVRYNWSYFLILKPSFTPLCSNIYNENSRICQTILSVPYLKQFHSDTATIFCSSDGSLENQF
jgi:hypothetical protein